MHRRLPNARSTRRGPVILIECKNCGLSTKEGFTMLWSAASGCPDSSGIRCTCDRCGASDAVLMAETPLRTRRPPKCGPTEQ